ncbi:hypothetical protein MD484_g5020, partial [Candolleomyces efflorescens]
MISILTMNDLKFDFTSGTYYYLIPFSANTHVYVISVTSMLMAREGLRHDLERSFHLSDLMISFHKSEIDPTSTSGSSKVNHAPSVQVGDNNDTQLRSQRDERVVEEV